MSTILWHNEVSDKWMDAFPLGNGRVGAMVYGTPDCEVIEINEESLWCGRQIQEKYHASPEALAEIRKLIFEERLKEAADLASKTFLSDPIAVRSYESFGEIFIDFFDKSPIRPLLIYALLKDHLEEYGIIFCLLLISILLS